MSVKMKNHIGVFKLSLEKSCYVIENNVTARVMARNLSMCNQKTSLVEVFRENLH